LRVFDTAGNAGVARFVIRGAGKPGMAR